MTSAIIASHARRAIEMLMNPLMWAFILCILIGLYLIFKTPDKTTQRAGIALLLFFFGFYWVTTPWLPEYMTKRLEMRYPRVMATDESIQFIVVLGGGVVDSRELSVSDRLSNGSLKRVLEGVRLYQALPHATLISSGGVHPDKARTVGMRMDAEAKWLGVPDAHRMQEVDSINTREEAVLIKKIVQNKPFYLVTSATHVPRSMALFKAEGMQPIAAPCDYRTTPDAHRQTVKFLHFFPDASNLELFNNAWHEYLGLLWAFVRGYI